MTLFDDQIEYFWFRAETSHRPRKFFLRFVGDKRSRKVKKTRRNSSDFRLHNNIKDSFFQFSRGASKRRPYASIIRFSLTVYNFSFGSACVESPTRTDNENKNKKKTCFILILSSVSLALHVLRALDFIFLLGSVIVSSRRCGECAREHRLSSHSPLIDRNVFSLKQRRTLEHLCDISFVTFKTQSV